MAVPDIDMAHVVVACTVMAYMTQAEDETPWADSNVFDRERFARYRA